MHIAIVGGGVTGLVAAHALHPDHEITVFEQEGAPGGHAQTVLVRDNGRELGIDVGFIVFNRENYPHFSRLLDQLGVATQPSEMSFGLSCRRCGIEYSSRGVSGLFARRTQLFRPRIYWMAGGIVRFNRWARRQTTEGLGTRTIGDLRRAGFFGDAFFAHYLVPMTAAIWSSTGLDVEEMPLTFLLSFYRNHGLLQVHGHPPWRTITGGSARYVETLTRPFRSRMQLSTPVRAVRRNDADIELRTDHGWARFDGVVLATHTDQALRMLQDPTDDEQTTLSAIPYRRNEAVLHTDDRVLPRAGRARASWNYHVDDCRSADAPLSMTYDLTRLMELETERRYCVTLNDTGRIDPARVLRRLSYAHPLYRAGSLDARQRLRRLNRQPGGTWFCGAYLGNGFHEDGVRAGLETAALIQRRRAAA